MNKIMIAAAACALTGAVFAESCAPDPIAPAARVYDVKLNVKTTKGIAVGAKYNTGTQCAPGTASICTVIRSKDSTTIKGYIYLCEAICDVKTYSNYFWDSKRKGYLTVPATFDWDILNVMGQTGTAAEGAWTLTATFGYDAMRAQEYALRGAGFGRWASDKYGVYLKNMSGNFAGYASASYDLTTKYTEAIAECICKASQILTCADFGTAVYTDANTAAYGTWTLKYNASVSKAYQSGKWLPPAITEL